MSDEQRIELNLSSYYFDFTPTGVYEIDRILHAVARAGKAYHHTEWWADEDDTPNQIDLIQEAANHAAQGHPCQGDDCSGRAVSRFKVTTQDEPPKPEHVELLSLCIGCALAWSRHGLVEVETDYFTAALEAATESETNDAK